MSEQNLLRDVSRSFYLTLRVLPAAIRDQIGLAYLLARATDTIADTSAVPVGERLAALGKLRARILAKGAEQFIVPRLQEHQSSRAERILLERINEAVAKLAKFESEDRESIRWVLRIIAGGQELDLIRFGAASVENIVALQSDAELDDYTYRVAGCVGEFWTRMCVSHLQPKPSVPLETLVERGVRFGKGLQLVNILRDLPADLRSGRCYLPWPTLRLLRLQPGDLLNPANEENVRPLYNEWLATAEGHLTVAWQYVLGLPRRWWRVRLACAWPVLIGLRTLDRLRAEPVLNPDKRIKVSRSEVKRIVRQSIFLYPFAAAWERLPQRQRARPE